MKGLGIRTVRILNTEIFDNLDGVVEMIGAIVEEQKRRYPVLPKNADAAY